MIVIYIFIKNKKMSNKKKIVKIFAILGLLWIIISIIWTGILVLTSQNTQSTQIDWKNITQEQLQKIINDNKIKIETSTWKIK